MTRILIVDDDPDIRSLLRDVLEIAGHQVDEAIDGPGALAMLSGETPDCVILDIMMPGLSGIDVLARVRAESLNQQLPVLLLTAATDDQTAWAGWSAGANSYLTKPFDQETLLRWIANANANADGDGTQD